MVGDLRWFFSAMEELLPKAALAAGVGGTLRFTERGTFGIGRDGDVDLWNPVFNQGQADQMIKKLGISTSVSTADEINASLAEIGDSDEEPLSSDSPDSAAASQDDYGILIVINVDAKEVVDTITVGSKGGWVSPEANQPEAVARRWLSLRVAARIGELKAKPMH